MAASPAVPCVLPRLPGYTGAACYAALPAYAAALRDLVHCAEPPFDPLRMAAASGASVQALPTYEGNRGLLVPLRDGSYRIIVSARETRGAQRFTVAHELVELGLQRGCPALVERSYHDAGAGRAKERYCEAGAAEILMPLTHLRAELAARRGITALLELTALFGTSLHAMLRRIVSVSERPCIGLIMCEGAPEPGPGVLGAPSPRPALWSRLTDKDELPGTRTRLHVRAAYGRGACAGAVPAGTAIAPQSLLARCYRERTGLRGVEDLRLGRLHGRYEIEAICPGHGPGRHIYAILYPAR